MIIALAGLAFVISGRSVNERSTETHEALPVIAEVPDFTLTERDGATKSRSDLLGRVWLADFIFTSCAGPCPELTLRMRSLQEALRKTGRAVQLVSITVDPETDTPAVLRRYADRYHADPARWWFLTGSSETRMHDLVKRGFLQAVAPGTDDGPLIHSTRFLLIDAQGRIRAAYDGLDADAKERILVDADSLISESAGS